MAELKLPLEVPYRRVVIEFLNLVLSTRHVRSLLILFPFFSSFSVGIFNLLEFRDKRRYGKIFQFQFWSKCEKPSKFGNDSMLSNVELNYSCVLLDIVCAISWWGVWHSVCNDATPKTQWIAIFQENQIQSTRASKFFYFLQTLRLILLSDLMEFWESAGFGGFNRDWWKS